MEPYEAEIARATIAAPEQLETEFRCGIGGCRKTSSTLSGISNHRTWVHKLQSQSPEAVARAARRDRARPGRVRVSQLRKPAPPIPKPAEGVRTYVPPARRRGPLNLGELEHLRKRLIYEISTRYSREVDREPGEVCAAIAILCAERLRPKGLQRINVPGLDGYVQTTR